MQSTTGQFAVIENASGGAIAPDREHVLPSLGQRAGKGILVLIGRPEVLKRYDELVGN